MIRQKKRDFGQKLGDTAVGRIDATGCGERTCGGGPRLAAGNFVNLEVVCFLGS
jgi:hypothetical protein